MKVNKKEFNYDLFYFLVTIYFMKKVLMIFTIFIKVYMNYNTHDETIWNKDNYLRLKNTSEHD